MNLLALLLAGAAFAAQAPAPKAPEEALRTKLAEIRSRHEKAAREAVMGAGEELRDAVASGKKQMANRLPGMSAEPFNLCRDLARCAEAPLSLHVEDDTLIDDAFMALARPWFNLQKARGKEVTVTVDPGQGVQLALSGLPAQPSVTLESIPAPTGGFDVTLREGEAAAAVYARERAAILQPKQP